MNETKKVDMQNWNAFVRRVLDERQDKPDNKSNRENEAEKGNLRADYFDTKKAGKRGGFFERD